MRMLPRVGQPEFIFVGDPLHDALHGHHRAALRVRNGGNLAGQGRNGHERRGHDGGDKKPHSGAPVSCLTDELRGSGATRSRAMETSAAMAIAPMADHATLAPGRPRDAASELALVGHQPPGIG